MTHEAAHESKNHRYNLQIDERQQKEDVANNVQSKPSALKKTKTNHQMTIAEYEHEIVEDQF
jgi:hypothetical protein